MNSLYSSPPGPCPRAACTLLLALALVASRSHASPPQAQPGREASISQIDTSSWPVARVFVSVREPGGESVVGLTRQDFGVLSNGRPLTDIQVTAVSPESQWQELVFLVDRSGSMRGDKLAAAVQAGLDFVNRLGLRDAVLVGAFDSTLTFNPQDFTTDRAALRAALSELSPGDNTSLRDALLEAATRLTRRQAPRRGVVVLTDGQDTTSRAEPVATLRALEEARVPVYAVVLGEEADHEWLASVAAATGGGVFAASAASDLLTVYQAIARRIQNEYVIAFEVPDASSTTEHHVSVLVRDTPTRAERRYSATHPGVVSTTRPLLAAAAAAGSLGLLAGWTLGIAAPRPASRRRRLALTLGTGVVCGLGAVVVVLW